MKKRLRKKLRKRLRKKLRLRLLREVRELVENGFFKNGPLIQLLGGRRG